VKWYQNESSTITNMMLFAKTLFRGYDAFTQVKACFLKFGKLPNRSKSNEQTWNNWSRRRHAKSSENDVKIV
jgi:hypothetical protein